MSAIVQKLLPAWLPSAHERANWNYCNVLRDDLSACDAKAGGMSYLLARNTQASGDYPSTLLRTGSDQLTYLLFLKMADERTKPFGWEPAL